MNKSNSIGRLSFIALFAAISLFFFAGCAPEEVDEVEEEEAATVSVVKATPEAIRETITEVGELQSPERINVRAQTDGELLSSHFEEGEMVEKGELLFTVDDELQRQEVESSRQSLEEARATLENNRKNYERIKNLFQRGLAPQQRYDDARAALDSARARVEGLESQLQAAKKRLDDAHLEAPFPGKIGEKLVDPGEVVSPGQSLAILQKLDPLEVRFAISERYAARVREGMRLEVHPGSLVDKCFEGEVTFVNPEITSATRNLLVKGKIDNNGILKPGGYARTELILEVSRDNPVIPARALVGVREGYIVYRVVDGKARRTPVRVGLREPGRVEIVEGLEEEDRIVESGHEELADGHPVTTAEDHEGTAGENN